MYTRRFAIFAMIFTVLLSFFGGSVHANPAAPSTVGVNLAVDQVAFTTAEGVVVHVTISNPTNHFLNLLRWYTPFNGLEEPLFIVTRDGEPVNYIGAYYKRPAPTGTDYITLDPGASMTATVDLAKFYDLSVSGTYTIAYDVAALYANSMAGEGDDLEDVDGAAPSATMASNALDLQVEGRAKWTPPQTAAAVSGEIASVSFVGCSSSRRSALNSAHNSASSYAANSANYLQAGRQGSRYITWFGAYNSSRYSTVRSNFYRIRNALDTAAITYDCTCTDNYYAYVYPSQPYDIYLCNAFWSAPTTGTDSKAGTIVHEMSHFNIVAGTDDWVYGQTGAKDLARTNPSRAINNADNHEYFAENTPSLP